MLSVPSCYDELNLADPYAKPYLIHIPDIFWRNPFILYDFSKLLEVVLYSCDFFRCLSVGINLLLELIALLSGSLSKQRHAAMGTVLQDDDPLPPDEIDAIRTQTTTAQSTALEELWPLIEVTLSRMSKAKIFTNVD
ncbi:hypothetical protein E4U45_000943, partial [Claviceps purpurea]